MAHQYNKIHACLLSVKILIGRANLAIEHNWFEGKEGLNKYWSEEGIILLNATIDKLEGVKDEQYFSNLPSTIEQLELHKVEIRRIIEEVTVVQKAFFDFSAGKYDILDPNDKILKLINVIGDVYHNLHNEKKALLEYGKLLYNISPQPKQTDLPPNYTRFFDSVERAKKCHEAMAKVQENRTCSQKDNKSIVKAFFEYANKEKFINLNPSGNEMKEILEGINIYVGDKAFQPKRLKDWKIFPNE